MDFSHLEKVITNKKRSPTKGFQVRALDVMKELNIPNRYIGQIMKLAKESPYIFERTYTFMKDYNNPRASQLLFFWYYNKLKKEIKWKK